MDINTAVMLGVFILLIAASWFLQGGEGMIDGLLAVYLNKFLNFYPS